MVSILWIGLVAGTLDITENLVFNLFRGITPWPEAAQQLQPKVV